MACTLSQITSAASKEVSDKGLRRSFSAKDLKRRAGIQRSYSDNHLSYQIGSIKASTVQPKLKNSRSVGFFTIPDTIKSFLFEPEMKTEELSVESDDDVDEMEVGKRANWIEKLVEIRDNWRDKQEKVNGYDDDGGCEVEHDEEGDNDDENGKREIDFDSEIFSSFLGHVSWSDTKMFSQLAFLCNMAYAIPDMKTGDLRRYYGLDFVTSSIEKKVQAKAAIKEKVEQDSTTTDNNLEQIISSRRCSSDAYEIAASAASYVQSRVKDETFEDDYKSEKMAARVAASTMTAVVAAGEMQKEKAAKDLQSLHSSPCEWFVCDDSTIYTRYFVIQGSESLASWQANLFFEPTKFEGTNVLVHRGIYEAAKGIYEQFMPEIKQHMFKYGERAKLQFTGHSLGGSLALLVNLMLLTRNEVKSTSLLPVVTFGSPFVFCGGHKILDQLGLDDNHVHCVMMHRDIVPRAFSCDYPDYVAQVLKRLNGTFRSHPCLNKNKLMYTPMGKIFILQPDEKSSPPHPLLPPGRALYAFNRKNNSSLAKSAIRAFLNSPHPIETLSDPKAYGSEGTILRDHESSNYLKALNEVIRQHTRLVVRKARKQRHQLWPLLTSRLPHAWSHTEVNEELLTRV
ncbi:hypothetical protein CASFOL_041367 [Castilleja foliolosa]|uniref:Fungal lipase-type domain-containing protein n=1 Tax=Castilleja foliolosa TaxID=1961234 RepID=A0ABD3BF65_9LAMI